MNPRTPLSERVLAAISGERTGTVSGPDLAVRISELCVKWLPPIAVNLADVEELPATVLVQSYNSFAQNPRGITQKTA